MSTPLDLRDRGFRLERRLGLGIEVNRIRVLNREVFRLRLNTLDRDRILGMFVLLIRVRLVEVGVVRRRFHMRRGE